MINIPVDDAFAFDYISILAVKNERFKNQILNLIECCQSVKNQIGTDLFHEILDSDEYETLKQANRDTFDAVEKAKFNLVTAKYVDDCNYKRYKSKQELQKKFFNKQLTEFKT